MLRALTRQVGAGIASAVRTFIEPLPIDVRIARSQQRGYESALRALGVQVESLPPLNDLPDSVFVEDTVVVINELAIITRPGIDSRRGETAHMTRALAPYCRLAFIDAPGTLEGGDVLRIGTRFLVGASGRTNIAGAEQLARLVAPHGCTVEVIPLQGALHFKSAVTAVGDDTVLINPNWVDMNKLGVRRVLCVARNEPWAANVLPIGERILVSDSYPETRAILEKAGYRTQAVNVSELHKAEAGLTCMSVFY